MRLEPVCPMCVDVGLRLLDKESVLVWYPSGKSHKYKMAVAIYKCEACGTVFALSDDTHIDLNHVCY